MRTKTMTKREGKIYHIEMFPNFHKSGSIKGMKEKFYGKDALLVRCGSYIYNVSSRVYHAAH